MTEKEKCEADRNTQRGRSLHQSLSKAERRQGERSSLRPWIHCQRDGTSAPETENHLLTTRVRGTKMLDFVGPAVRGTATLQMGEPGLSLDARVCVCVCLFYTLLIFC